MFSLLQADESSGMIHLNRHPMKSLSIEIANQLKSPFLLSYGHGNFNGLAISMDGDFIGWRFQWIIHYKQG